MMTTPRVISLAFCQHYFRMIEILKHWLIVGKQMSKGQLECVRAKEWKECSPSRVGGVVLPRSRSNLQSKERRD